MKTTSFYVNRTKYLVMLLLIPQVIVSQISNSELEAKIDSLFGYYNDSQGPGIAVGILQNGEELFSKGYGMANLENQIPITSKTLFNIGSVAKQFTAYAIAQLEKEGKLSYNDDISQYLPDLKDFGPTITIDNLLFHNSGIRDFNILRGYIDGRVAVGKEVTNDSQLRLLYQQQELNFPTGTKFNYSNSGYILLSEIVEKVTQMSFPEYLKQNLFEPLEMHDTFLPTKPPKSIKNAATPYIKEDKAFVIADGMLFATYGNSDIYSNLDDMFKWQRHLHDQKQLLRTDSKTNTMAAMGLVLHKDSNGDIDEIFHYGSVPGYKSIVKYYPKLNLDVITFSNLDNSRGDAQKVESIITLFSDEKKVDDIPLTMKVPLSYLKKFEGFYVIRGENVPVAVENDILTIQTPMGKMNLEPIRKNEFKMAGTNRVIVFDELLEFFTLKVNGGEIEVPRAIEEKVTVSYKYSLSSFTGTYKSPELDIVNQIEVKDNTLLLTTASNEKIELVRKGETTFQGNRTFYYKSVEFSTDDSEISAFRATDEDGWVQNLLFLKM